MNSIETNKQPILKEIAECVINMDKPGVKKNVLIALDSNTIDIKEIYNNGLNFGMTKVLDKYDNKEYFLPEVVVCADALNEGISILKKYGDVNKKGAIKITMAVVKGDTHEIGKNIVKIMMEAAGFNVFDLGVNQDPIHIVNHALEHEVDIIALSSMMTSTMVNMKNVIDELNNRNIKNFKPKVIIGGAPVSERFAKEIGSDGYSDSAPEAVKLVKKIMSLEEQADDFK